MVVIDLDSENTIYYTDLTPVKYIVFYGCARKPTSVFGRIFYKAPGGVVVSTSSLRRLRWRYIRFSIDGICLRIKALSMGLKCLWESCLE